MIDETHTPFKRSKLYIFNLFTQNEDQLMKSFDLDLTPDIIVWTFYGDRQLNGNYFYYAYFDIERQNHDLYLLNLMTLEIKKMDNKELESLVRPIYEELPDEVYERHMLRMKNDCIKLNCDMYDFGQYHDEFPSIHSKISEAYSTELLSNPDDIIFGLRFESDSENFVEYLTVRLCSKDFSVLSVKLIHQQFNW